MWIQISDTGIGISPESLPHIFDRFYQVDTSHTRAYEGTGIGLALVKELIDLMGGTIRVDSQQGIGTTFEVTVPVQSVLVNAKAPKVILVDKKYSAIYFFCQLLHLSCLYINQPIVDEQVPLILIVEDNDELREFLASETGCNLSNSAGCRWRRRLAPYSN